MAPPDTLSLILRSAVLASPPRSRSEIAEDTGLTKPTVSRHVEQLIGSALLEEGEATVRGAGRPSTPLVPAQNGPVGIGVAIAADHLSALAVDLSGAPLLERTSIRRTEGEAPDITVGRLASLIHELAGELTGRNIADVCVSVPGRLSPDGRSVHSAPNLSWKGVNLQAQCEAALTDNGSTSWKDRFHGAVTLRNDAQLAALTEIPRRGPSASFFYVFGETGIGGAVVVDGQALLGVNGWAGEVGHITVDPAGPACRCGRRGCLEALVSYDALRRQAGLGSDVLIHDVVEALIDRRADRTAVINHIGVPLGHALANSMNLLDLPDIILAGYFAPIAEELGPVLRDVLDEHALAAELKPITVSAASDDPHPALSGAAATAIESVLSDAPGWIRRSQG